MPGGTPSPSEFLPVLWSRSQNTKAIAMHVRGLIELAGILATHGPVLLHGREPLSAESIEQYWTTSKVRLDRWAWALKQFRQQADAKPQGRPQPAMRGVLEEVLVSELLTRVWTAVLSIYDRQRGDAEVEPVGRSVLLGHMEARHRVLTLMLHGPGLDAEAALDLNHVRRRAERWTDLLIGSLMRIEDVSEFAIEPDRAKDFADDIRERGLLRGGRQAWSLTMASLKAAFRNGLSPVSPNSDLNARIASSILSCFPPETFDSTGLFRSVWLMRLADVADDAQGMIEEILSDTPAGGLNVNQAKKSGMASDRCEPRMRRFGRP